MLLRHGLINTKNRFLRELHLKKHDLGDCSEDYDKRKEVNDDHDHDDNEWHGIPGMSFREPPNLIHKSTDQ